MKSKFLSVSRLLDLFFHRENRGYQGETLSSSCSPTCSVHTPSYLLPCGLNRCMLFTCALISSFPSVELSPFIILFLLSLYPLLLCYYATKHIKMFNSTLCKDMKKPKNFFMISCLPFFITASYLKVWSTFVVFLTFMEV